MKTPEELLKPRYKVLADWPFQTHEIGAIITGSEAALCCTKYDKSMLSDYPALFAPLAWWEERPTPDLGGSHRYDSGYEGPNESGCWDTYEQAQITLIAKMYELYDAKPKKP